MPKQDLSNLQAEVLAYHEVHELPGDWGPDALRSLLAVLEIDIDNVPESDLLDMVLMGLGDLEPREAGIAVLGEVFGEKMSLGLRSNLATDLEDDRPWENFADLSCQEGIFTATVLLQKAFPKNYGKPDAARAELVLQAESEADAKQLLQAPAAVILRALSPGMGTRSILARLYEEGLRQDPFPEADHILWKFQQRLDDNNARRVIVDLFGPQSFFAGLDDAPPWQAEVDLNPH